MPKGRERAGGKIKVQQSQVGLIIGKGGSTLRSIIEKTGADVEVDQSTKGEGYSTVHIRSGKGAAEAREIIGKILNGACENMQGAPDERMKIEQHLVGLVVGPSGKTMKEIAEHTGARLSFDQSTKDKGFSTLLLAGSKESIANALDLVRMKLKNSNEFNMTGGVATGEMDGDTEGTRERNSENMKIQQQHVGWLIGTGGETLRSMQQATKCALYMDQSTKVQGFSILHMTGSAEAIQDARKVVIAKVEENGGRFFKHESQSFKIPQRQVGLVLGKSGQALRKIQESCRVSIEIDQSTREKGYSTVHIQPGDGASKASQMIQDLMNADSSGSRNEERTEMILQQHVIYPLLQAGGEVLRKIERQTGSTILLDKGSSQSSFSSIQICGSSSAVSQAQALIKDALAGDTDGLQSQCEHGALDTHTVKSFPTQEVHKTASKQTSHAPSAADARPESRAASDQRSEMELDPSPTTCKEPLKLENAPSDIGTHVESCILDTPEEDNSERPEGVIHKMVDAWLNAWDSVWTTPTQEPATGEPDEAKLSEKSPCKIDFNGTWKDVDTGSVLAMRGSEQGQQARPSSGTAAEEDAQNLLTDEGRHVIVNPPCTDSSELQDHLKVDPSVGEPEYAIQAQPITAAVTTASPQKEKDFPKVFPEDGVSQPFGNDGQDGGCKIDRTVLLEMMALSLKTDGPSDDSSFRDHGAGIIRSYPSDSLKVSSSQPAIKHHESTLSDLADGDMEAVQKDLGTAAKVGTCLGTASIDDNETSNDRSGISVIGGQPSNSLTSASQEDEVTACCVEGVTKSFGSGANLVAGSKRDAENAAWGKDGSKQTSSTVGCQSQGWGWSGCSWSGQWAEWEWAPRSDSSWWPQESWCAWGDQHHSFERGNATSFHWGSAEAENAQRQNTQRRNSLRSRSPELCNANLNAYDHGNSTNVRAEHTGVDWQAGDFMRDANMNATDSKDTIAINVPQNLVGFIIGKAGSQIIEISGQTGARVQFDQSTAYQGYSTLHISGSPEAVIAAKTLVEEKLQEPVSEWPPSAAQGGSRGRSRSRHDRVGNSTSPSMGWEHSHSTPSSKHGTAKVLRSVLMSLMGKWQGEGEDNASCRLEVCLNVAPTRMGSAELACRCYTDASPKGVKKVIHFDGRDILLGKEECFFLEAVNDKHVLWVDESKPDRRWAWTRGWPTGLDSKQSMSVDLAPNPDPKVVKVPGSHDKDAIMPKKPQNHDELDSVREGDCVEKGFTKYESRFQ